MSNGMKRFITLFLAVLMVMGILAGCKSESVDLDSSITPKPAETGAATDAGGATQAPDEPQTQYDFARISWYFNEGGNQVIPESYVVRKIKEDINVEFVHVTLPTGMDYMERLMVLVAGSDTPDIIDASSFNNISLLLAEDLIIPLEDYMTQEYIPNVMRITLDWDTVIKDLAWSDGHTYTIPSAFNNPLQTTPWIRQDWLDTLGLSMPTTMEELAVVLKAFVGADPNGDGIPTYSTMTDGVWSLSSFFDAHGAGMNWYPGEDGLPEIGILSPRVKDALAYIKDLYDAGAINQDFVTTTYDVLTEKVKAGLVGYHYGWNSNASFESIKEVYPDAKWVPMEPVKGIYDKGYIDIAPPNPVRNFYTISTSCRDVEAALRLMDYMCVDASDENGMVFEGSYWNAMGERGVNWDVVDGIFENGNGDSGDEALAKKFSDQNAIDKWIASPSLRFRNQFDTRWMGVNEYNRSTLEFMLGLPRGKDIPDSDPYKPYANLVIEDGAITTFFDDYVYVKFLERFCYDAIMGKGDIDQLYEAFLELANSDGYQNYRQQMKNYVPER